MFNNFIYFIVVLLIYTTYQPTDKTYFTPFWAFFLFLLLTAAYSLSARIQFHRIEKQAARETHYRMDHKFNALVTRHSILAIMVFAVNIYGLNLPTFIIQVPLFARMPTLQALLFVGLFVFYLTVMWTLAHSAYKTLYDRDLPRREYVSSNISFSVPILLPWFLLSIISDLINALPFNYPRQLFFSTEGQIVYFLIFLFAVAMIGPVMIQKFWRCKPLQAGPVRSRIENLCQRAGVEVADILYWPIFGGRMLTAGVMGLAKKFRYILVTEALLNYLDSEELDAVIAHEIGHVKKRHLLFYIFFMAGPMLLSFTSFNLIIYFVIFIEPVYRFITLADLNQTSIISGIRSVAIILIFLIYFRYIFGYFMRNFERQADLYVFALFDSGKPLISTLEKIAGTSGQAPDRPNWHHFSILERITYLKKCETDRGWIARQNRKIKKSILVYLAGLLLIGAAGYHLNFGDGGKNLNDHFVMKIIQREIGKSPNDSTLYSILGDQNYSMKNYAATVAAYSHALELNPDNPHALNNLAWLYATVEDQRFKNPLKALEYARRAAKLLEAPHLMDTLAESYFVNGMYPEAAAAGKRALDLAQKNRAYYEKQLAKFKEADEKG
ncbi:MAG: M48 family metalloprotease [Desulfobacterales bacterium]|nr:M48 family metalloprotease [Desulfobacterales bacterium]